MVFQNLSEIMSFLWATPSNNFSSHLETKPGKELETARPTFSLLWGGCKFKGVVCCLFADENWSEKQEETNEVGDKGASAGEMSMSKPLVRFPSIFPWASPSQQTHLMMSSFST